MMMAVNPQQISPGLSANYAKEMERLSAKESLLLALDDSGGFKSLVSGKTSEMQRIDVNERIVGLERLNPTPRPTTAPVFEGQWKFEWFGGSSPGLLAAKVLFQMSPETLAKLTSLNLLVKDGYSKVTASLTIFNSIESKFILTTKLSVEGPIRMKEEYEQGLLQMPEQLKGALQQLPDAIKEVLATGFNIPLNGSFQRFLTISYLDDDILIVRDTTGAPDVLRRSDSPPEPEQVDTEIIPE